MPRPPRDPKPEKTRMQHRVGATSRSMEKQEQKTSRQTAAVYRSTRSQTQVYTDSYISMTTTIFYLPIDCTILPSPICYRPLVRQCEPTEAYSEITEIQCTIKRVRLNFSIPMLRWPLQKVYNNNGLFCYLYFQVKSGYAHVKSRIDSHWTAGQKSPKKQECAGQRKKPVMPRPQRDPKPSKPRRQHPVCATSRDTESTPQKTSNKTAVSQSTRSQTQVDTYSYYDIFSSY